MSESWEAYQAEQEGCAIEAANDELVRLLLAQRVVFDRACIIEDEIYVLRCDRLFRVWYMELHDSSTYEQDLAFTVESLADDLRGQPTFWWEYLLFYLRTQPPPDHGTLFGSVRRRLEVSSVPFRERIQGWRTSGRVTHPSLFDPSYALAPCEAHLDDPIAHLGERDPTILDPGKRLEEPKPGPEFGDTRNDYWRNS